jgi:hypothetical protein
MTEGTRWQFVGLIAVLVALHFILRVGLGLGPLAPDLLVVGMLLAARRMRAGWAAGLGVPLGVMEGAVNSVLLGPASLALVVLGFAGSRSRDQLAGDSPALLVLYLFVGKWVYDILVYLVLAMNGSAGSAAKLIVDSPVAALYAAFAGLAAVAAYRAVV